VTKLSVNVNKIATLRNARGKNLPDLLKMTLDIISYGAQGITVHPRPDGRHIRTEDVYHIAEKIKVEFNIEGYPSKDYLHLLKEIKPTQATLVPDPPDAITSNAGWQIKKNFKFLQDIVAELHTYGARTSLFIDPNTISDDEIELLKEIGTDRIELYTESYADAFGTSEETKTLDIYKYVANKISKANIGINAGHDLNLFNLTTLIKTIPAIKEVSIGHALICDALYFGLKDTIARYLTCLK
jgi:pyridoxine 5-phosphate synthase